MSATKSYRYNYELKGSQHTCPGCNARKQFTRYVDTQTGELLPEEFGRCNNGGKCGYDLSPYHKGPSGLSYTDEVKQHEQLPLHWFTLVGKWKRSGVVRSSAIDSLVLMEGATHEQAEAVAAYIYDRTTRQPKQAKQPQNVYALPNEVFTRSLNPAYYSDYPGNAFARLLWHWFGNETGTALLQRFHVGTSAYWPGANVFWLIDAVGRVRGGQVVLFGEDGHTAKYEARNGERKRCTSWVHFALLDRYKKQGETAPEWLTDYDQNAPKFPVLFGLHQLNTAPTDTPVAIVEAPATAIFCSGYFPEYLWFAVGALDWLTAERLANVKGRRIRLFPDLSPDGSAYQKWSQRAEQLRATGFSVEVDTFLETVASDQQRANKYDLRDYLQEPRLALDGRTIYGELLPVSPCTDYPNGYPPEWDFSQTAYSK